MISRKMIAKIKENKGFSLTSILATVVIIGVLAFPMAKWFMSTAGNIGTDQEKAAAQTEKMEMQSVIQQYWQSMIDMSYDDFQAEIASKGTKRTETLGKYDLTIEFSGDSKYANALCNVGTAAGASDRHCRRANITLVSKRNPSIVESFQATRVQPASLESKLLKLAKDLEDQGRKFKDYDTKTEADNKYACPWDYHLVNEKCVACAAPSNWKQYRSGNCTLGTCPTGKKANAARTGCEAITCSGRTSLSGDNCVACPLSGKEYYTASSGCAKSTCPTGKKANAAKTGCEAITCTEGQVLKGDDCVVPLKVNDSNTCAKNIGDASQTVTLVVGTARQITLKKNEQICTLCAKRELGGNLQGIYRCSHNISKRNETNGILEIYDSNEGYCPSSATAFVNNIKLSCEAHVQHNTGDE